MADDQVVIGGIYAHYKAGNSPKAGNLYTYEVIAVGRDTETDEVVIVYKQLYEKDGFPVGHVWVRSRDGVKGFTTPEGDKPRFRLIE